MATQVVLHVLQVTGRSLLDALPVHSAAGALPDFNALAELEEGFSEELAEDGDGHGDGGEAGVVIAAELSDDGGGLVDGLCDEDGVVAVGGVPVTAVEDADGVANVGEGLEEADEAAFVVELGA